ncbi:hypothetical protein [Paenibacillus alkalitolerans]|uniref:hypothetical protein n=1 Tax=Paenibacillus alkalitolerans TaxID=2799335 RepID=UPI0018F5BF5D|nr:hypothetical protein [Paenibacillus alkalitolerans]
MQMGMGEMTDWLLGHVNESVIIRKEEEGDVDQVMLELEKISYRAGQPEADDYVDDDRIILHGKGKIAADEEGGASGLPRNSYEIALEGDCSGTLQNNELLIRTERAVYRVAPVRQ